MVRDSVPLRCHDPLGLGRGCGLKCRIAGRDPLGQDSPDSVKGFTSVGAGREAVFGFTRDAGAFNKLPHLKVKFVSNGTHGWFYSGISEPFFDNDCLDVLVCKKTNIP